MLLLAMQKGHFPFKMGTFSHHFKSLGWRGARAPLLVNCISENVDYLNKEKNYKNSTKGVTL